MPPTSKKVKGQIGLGLFVCPSIYPHAPYHPSPFTPPPPPPPRKKFYTTGMGYNIFVFSMCVYVCVCVSFNNFRVRSITFKRLDIFSCNFTATLNIIRRRAEHKNHNSGFPTFGVIALCVLTIFLSAPLYLKPLDIFSGNLIQTLNAMRRHAEHTNRNSRFPTFGVIAICVLKIVVSAP